MRRSNIIMVARSFVGTRFGHLGRTPGVRLDCVGVLACTCAAFNYNGGDEKYSRRPTGPRLRETLDAHFDRVPGPRPGGVGLYKWNDDDEHPQHVVVYTDTGMIHAHMSCRSVVEVTDLALTQLIACYDFKGVDAWLP